LGDLKFWMQKGSCEQETGKPTERQFRLFKYLIKHQKEYDK
jgi:hypothetical protein